MRKTSPEKAAENIESIIQIKGLVKRDICSQAGVNPGYFAPKNIKARKYPSLEVLLILQDALNEPLEKILFSDYSAALKQKEINYIDNQMKELRERRNELSKSIVANARARLAEEKEELENE